MTVAPDVWISLTADLTPANVADNEQTPTLLEALVQRHLFLLGNRAYHNPALREHCWARQRTTVTTRRDAYPHTDQGVEVCRVFHHLRTHAIENFNGQFKVIFNCGGQVATRAWWPPDASRSGRSLSINSPSSTVSRLAARCVLVSSHSSSLLEDS